MSRKWSILILSLAVILTGFAARGPIVSTFFQWYLKGYCRSCLESKLTYQSAYHENGKWVFEYPVLTAKSRLEQGGYCCQAERATVTPSVDWLKRSLALNVEVESPHIDVGSEAKALKELFIGSTHPYSFFNVHTVFTTPQGTVLIHDFSEDNLVPLPLFFSVDLACRDKHEGCASIWVGSSSKGSRDFFAVLSEKDPDTSQLALDFHNVDISSLYQTLRGLWPESAQLEITHGSLSGNFIVTLPKQGNIFAEGQVSLENFLAHHTGTGSTLSVPSLTLNLSPKTTVEHGMTVMHTLAHLEISPLTNLVMSVDEKPFWTVENITSTLSFQSGTQATVTIDGLVTENGRQRQLHVEGLKQFQEAEQADFSVSIQFKGKRPQDNTSLSFSTRPLSEKLLLGELNMASFGSEEITLLQHLFKNNYPSVQQFHIERGHIDASATIHFKERNISEVNVENITASNLEVDYSPWSLHSSASHVSGAFSLDFMASDPLKTIDADLDLNNGMLTLEGTSQAIWQFSGIQTHLSIHQGIFQKSILNGTAAGLKGEVILDGNSSGPLATLHFKGPIDDFSQILPDPIRQSVEKKFKENHITISAGADKYPNGMFLSGKLFIDEDENPKEEIAFGFALEKRLQKIGLHWSQQDNNDDCSQDSFQETQTSIVPALAASAHVIYRHLTKDECRSGDLIVKNGWFSGSDLPLEKYVSPFVFVNNQMEIKGLGNFQGNFNEKNLVMHYDAKNIVVENDAFCIEIPSIERKSDIDPSWPATYVYHFDKPLETNMFPIHNGTFFDKNTGLLFTDVNTDAIFENSTARFSPLTAFSNGLYFGGGIDLDWSMPGEGVFRIDVNANEMHGKISELQHFLSHIENDNPLLKIPIEGSASLQKGGSSLSFLFNKDDFELRSSLHGRLSDGVFKGENVDISLQELGMNIDYDNDANTFTFSDLQGALLVGRPNHLEEYTVTADEIKFTDNDNQEMVFDIWINDQKNEFCRVAGKTKSVFGPNNKPLIEFDFNQTLTHFGNVHPKIMQMSLKDWSQMDWLQLEFEFQLDSLLTDLQKFSRTGLLFLSRSWLKEVNAITSAAGKFNAVLNYDGNRSVMNYRVAAEDVVLGDHEFKQFVFSGKKKDNLWSVDQMQFDDVSTAFDVIKDGKLWNINFLGIRVGNSFLMGMEGQYRDDDAHLEAKINLLKANLNELRQWPTLQKHLENHLIAGEVHAAGNIYADFDKSLPHGMRCDVKLSGSLKQGMIKDVFLQDIDNLSIHYNSDNNSLNVSLKNGIYHLMGTSHYIKNFILDWDPTGIRIGGEYPYKNKLFHFDAFGIAPEYNAGEVVISEATPAQTYERRMPLIVHWTSDPQEGYCIQKMTGTLCGMSFDLTNHPSSKTIPNAMSLIGKIDVNMHKAVVLTDGKVASGIENWEFGDGYSLTGQWNILKDGRYSLLDRLSFQGELLGRDFELLGYRFYDLTAQLIYFPGTAYIRNLMISDHCGTMRIGEMDFYQNNTEWQVNSPLLTINELTPALLRCTKPSPSNTSKSLKIRQIEVRNLSGILGYRNSFTGTGQLSFINPPKKNLQHTILAVPAEILTRIGLDLSVLTPVRGTIFYDINNGKASLTRFKDVYSKGRASKFYLPKNDFDSYVDFDGNLHLQVRMKQYNLIFKLAELFTVTVQGTLTKPSYSLQKQQERHEERSFKEIVQSK